MKNTKKKSICIRITDQEKELLERKAKETNQKMSALLINSALYGIRDIDPQVFASAMCNTCNAIQLLSDNFELESDERAVLLMEEIKKLYSEVKKLYAYFENSK